jgi:hypothetical protein
MVLKADDGDPHAIEISGSLGIIGSDIRPEVVSAIELDGEVTVRVIKVEDIAIDTVLTVELIAAESVAAQTLPEALLGAGLIAPELTSTLLHSWMVEDLHSTSALSSLEKRERIGCGPAHARACARLDRFVVTESR